MECTCDGQTTHERWAGVTQTRGERKNGAMRARTAQRGILWQVLALARLGLRARDEARGEEGAAQQHRDDVEMRGRE